MKQTTLISINMVRIYRNQKEGTIRPGVLPLKRHLWVYPKTKSTEIGTLLHAQLFWPMLGCYLKVILVDA